MKSTGGRAKENGLRLWLWRGHHGDRPLALWRCLTPPSKDDGEGGTSGLEPDVASSTALAERDQTLTARSAELPAQPQLIK